MMGHNQHNSQHSYTIDDLNISDKPICPRNNSHANMKVSEPVEICRNWESEAQWNQIVAELGPTFRGRWLVTEIFEAKQKSDF